MKLTPMERRVLSALCAGFTTKQIAWNMDISPRTVETHIANAKIRNDAKTTIQICIQWNDERNEALYEATNQPSVASFSDVQMVGASACR